MSDIHITQMVHAEFMLNYKLCVVCHVASSELKVLRVTLSYKEVNLNCDHDHMLQSTPELCMYGQNSHAFSLSTRR